MCGPVRSIIELQLLKITISSSYFGKPYYRQFCVHTVEPFEVLTMLSKEIYIQASSADLIILVSTLVILLLSKLAMSYAKSGLCI